MILAFFLSLLAFASQGLAGGGQLNKQIYCTPSKSPYQYNIGLAFAAPYKGIYGELPTADGSTFVTASVEIYDHTCGSPVYTNQVLWSDVNSTVYAPDSRTRISVQFPVYPTWRRYGKQCYPFDNPIFQPKEVEEACEDYESLYNCDPNNQQDSSFCSIKLGNLTIETQFDGGRELRVQYSRLFKYARTDVGDACNCWQEMDGYNYVFACGCAVNTDVIARGLPGLSPPGQTLIENYMQVQRRRVDPASMISVGHWIGGPGPMVATYLSTTSRCTTTSRHSAVATHSVSHDITSKKTTSTKKHSPTPLYSAKSTPSSKLTTSTKSQSSTSHRIPTSSTHKETTPTTLKTTPRSSKTVPTMASSKAHTASLCSLSPVSGTLVEHCAKETPSSNRPSASLCLLRVVSGTPVEHCAKETASSFHPTGSLCSLSVVSGTLVEKCAKQTAT